MNLESIEEGEERRERNLLLQDGNLRPTVYSHDNSEILFSY